MIKTLQSWEENGCAFSDCVAAFIKRHPNISVPVLESTILAHVTTFNPTNVAIVFIKLGEVTELYKFLAADTMKLSSNCAET